MSIVHMLRELTVGDCIASLPGFLVLLCVTPSAFHSIKGRDTSSYKDLKPAQKIGPFTAFEYMTGVLVLTSAVLTFNYIIVLLQGSTRLPDHLVNGSILLSMLVALIIHSYKPRNIIRPLIPTPVIWGVSCFSSRYHHMNPNVSLLYFIATSLMFLFESVKTSQTVKPRRTKRLGRRASFISAQMARGAFPKDSKAPPPTIHGLTRFEKLPVEFELAYFLNALLRKPEYERLISVVVTDPSGEVYWEPVPNFDVRNHILTRLVKDEAELMAYINSRVFLSLPLDKPLWELHMIENEDGNDALLYTFHHALGDSISIFNLAADVFTDADGKSLSREPFESRDDRIFKFSTRDIIPSIKSFFKIALLPILPGDTRTSLKDPYAPYKFREERQIVTMNKIPLAVIKDIKAKFGSTVNDVLTSILAGAFSRYLQSQEDLNASKKLKLRALMTVAFPRKLSECFKNLWCFLSVPLQVSPEIVSASERLLATKDSLSKLKNSPEAVIQLAVQEFVTKLLDHDIVAQMSLDVMTKHTCVFTNVVGPTKQVYCIGEPVLEMQPFIANVVNQISILSYNNEVMVNFVVDPKVVKEPTKLRTFFLEELSDLRMAAADMKGVY